VFHFHFEEKAQGLTISGTTAPPEEATETDPEQKWVPKELGSSPQRDDPLCSSGTAQGKSRQEKFERKPLRCVGTR
jgi:hypothetical protein